MTTKQKLTKESITERYELWINLILIESVALELKIEFITKST